MASSGDHARLWWGRVAGLAVGALLTGCVVAGCGVNDHVLLGRVEHLRNDTDTGRAVHIEAWGLHLSTHPLDAGLALGRTARTYFFPGDNSAPSAGATVTREAALDDVANGRLEPADEATDDWLDRAALAHDTAVAGVAGEVSRQRVRLTLGYNRRQALRVARDFDGIIRISMSDGERPAFSVRPSQEPEP